MYGIRLLSPAHEAPAGLVGAGALGDGVAVRLPDGSTMTAPNAVAASAVRHTVTQLGVPYQWGGTTPGVGLDCSGLTQWARITKRDLIFRAWPRNRTWAPR